MHICYSVISCNVFYLFRAFKAFIRKIIATLQALWHNTCLHSRHMVRLQFVVTQLYKTVLLPCIRVSYLTRRHVLYNNAGIAANTLLMMSL
jgi:hypothetical protein